MENRNHDSDPATQKGHEKPEAASKKSGIVAAILRHLASPTPTIGAMEAQAEVHLPAPQAPEDRSSGLREAGIAGDIYKVDDRDCGGITQ